MPFIHHQTISARSASDASGSGHFDVLEDERGFVVYDGHTGTYLHRRGTLASAIDAASEEADEYDRRARGGTQSRATMTGPTSRYSVQVSTIEAIVREFIADVRAAGPKHVKSEWPDLYQTYLHATALRLPSAHV
jgi:hypothetical protein